MNKKLTIVIAVLIVSITISAIMTVNVTNSVENNDKTLMINEDPINCVNQL
jgi:hypothetical protein